MRTKPMDTLLKLMTQYFMELCSIYVQHLEKIFNVLMMKTLMKDSSTQTTFRDVKKVRSHYITVSKSRTKVKLQRKVWK